MPAPTSAQINSYETAPSRIAAAIEGLSEAAMHHKPAEEDWSIHEVVIHLADSENIGFWRLRKTLAEEEPTLAVYDEAAGPTILRIIDRIARWLLRSSLLYVHPLLLCFAYYLQQPGNALVYILNRAR